MFFFLIFCFFSFLSASDNILKIKCDKNFVEINEKHITYELLILLQVGAHMNSLDESVLYSFLGDQEELDILISSYKNLNEAQSHINIINYLCVLEPQLEKFEIYIKNHATALIDIIKKQKLNVVILEEIENEKIRNKIKLSFVSMKDLRNILTDYSNRLELTVDEITDTLFCEKFLIITQDEDIMYHQKYKTSIYDLSCKKIIKEFFHKNKKLFFNNDKTKVIGEKEIAFERNEQIIIDLRTLKETFFNHKYEELVDIIGDIQVVQKYGPCHPVLIKKSGIELFSFRNTIYKNKNKNYGGFSMHNGEYNVFCRYNGQNIVFLQNSIFYVIEKVFPEFLDLSKIDVESDDTGNFLKFYLKDKKREKIIRYSTNLIKEDSHQDIEVKTCIIGHKRSQEHQWQKGLKPLATIPFGYDSHLVMGRKCVSLLKNNDLCRIRTYKNYISITDVYNSSNNIIESFYYFGEDLYHIDLNDIYQPTEEMLEKQKENNIKRAEIFQEKKRKKESSYTKATADRTADEMADKEKKQKLEQKSTTSLDSNDFQKIKIPISILWLSSIYVGHFYLSDHSFDVIRMSDNTVVDSVTFPLRSIALIAFGGLLIIFRMWNGSPKELDVLLNPPAFWLDHEKQFTTLFRCIDDCFSCKKEKVEEKLHFFCNSFKNCLKNLETKEEIDKPHCNQCKMNLLSGVAVFAVVGVENGYVTKKNSVELFKKLTYFIVENSLINYKPIYIDRFNDRTQSHLKENSYSGFNPERAVETSFLKYAKKLFDTKEDYKEFKSNIISKSNHNTKGGFLCWKF